MLKPFCFLTCLLSILFASQACDEIIPELPADEETLDGPAEGLSHAEQARFLAGDIAFNDEIFRAENGLGPLFVAASCGSCHAGDGKGHPSTTLVRFGQSEPGDNPFLNQGGPQLQNRALPGFDPEPLPAGAPFMKLTPPAVTGLGLLAALSDEQLLANADPDDADGDGISGIPNYVLPHGYFKPGRLHRSFEGRYIGRFGKKAAAIDLLHQTVMAYNQDMGINSTFEPLDTWSGLGTDPEVSDQTIRNVVFYLRTLKAPLPRNSGKQEVIKGKTVFMAIGCASCHIPEWTTPESDIAALSGKVFNPYTDLLLHDMGPGLDDGATEGSAESYEWRTPPLWGLGLSPASQGGRYFLMHDGRAASIEEAIRMHGGEAARSSEQFQALPAVDREALIEFLESL